MQTKKPVVPRSLTPPLPTKEDDLVLDDINHPRHPSAVQKLRYDFATVWDKNKHRKEVMLGAAKEIEEAIRPEVKRTQPKASDFLLKGTEGGEKLVKGSFFHAAHNIQEIGVLYERRIAAQKIDKQLEQVSSTLTDEGRDTVVEPEAINIWEVLCKKLFG